MNTRTLCLNLVILLATLNPVMFVQTMLYSVSFGNNQSTLKLLKALVSAYAIIIALIVIPASSVLEIKLPTSDCWYFIALAAAAFNPCMEYCIGCVMLKLQGKTPKGASLVSSCKGASLNLIALTVLVAMFEELIYRQVWFNILNNGFKIDAVLATAIAALAYALNHMFFGRTVLVQKFFSAMVYGALFHFSGGCVIVPVIAHCVQNITILMKGRE